MESAVRHATMDQDNAVSELRREVAMMRRALFIAATAVLVGLMVWNLLVAWNIPRFEKIFEDMLGSRDKLPDLTKLVINYARGMSGVLPFALICSFTVAAWAAMNFTRHTSRFMMIAVAAAILLALHGAIIVLSVGLPLVQIMQGINEKA